jgi:DEAD/DEAH box helicase domain-containing protein
MKIAKGLLDLKDFENRIIAEKTIPAKPAVLSDFPESLSPEIKEFLKSQGIEKLYSHQTEMFETASQGKNIVITTSTSSTKDFGGPHYESYISISH